MGGTNGLKEATRDRAYRLEHARCEYFYRPGKDHGRRAATALRRSVVAENRDLPPRAVPSDDGTIPALVANQSWLMFGFLQP
jgi:hypothetical protein